MPVSGPEGAKDLHNLRWGRASAGGWTLVLSASVPDIRGGGAIGTSTGAQEHRMGMLGAGGNTNAGRSTYTGQDILAVIACSIFCIMSIKAKYIL